MDADIFISLSHFKGAREHGLRRAIKNIGMGCGSRAGKMDMHCAGKPDVDKSVCRGCGVCMKNCAHGAIAFDENRKAGIDHGKCVGCGRCIGACNFDAVYNGNDSANDELTARWPSTPRLWWTAARLFHINNRQPGFALLRLATVMNDTAIIPVVGMVLPAFDPVALDVACADACNPHARDARKPAGRKPARLRRRDITTILRMFLPIQIGARVWSGEKNRFGHTQL